MEKGRLAEKGAVRESKAGSFVMVPVGNVTLRVAFHVAEF
jgi:hypothetical protein